MSTFGLSINANRLSDCYDDFSNPIKAPWGIKAFTGYLGGDQSKWQEYDATKLVKKYTGPALNMLVDQEKADNFYVEGQLLPDNLSAECASNNVPINLRIHEITLEFFDKQSCTLGYDHSYYFIATFIEEHINHHAKFLFQ
ncbi:S-formylglutathione hydrolase-like [Dreissena polymorpha]|uniref:S-formylglutathione hydrolase-like n=1 Tax=Dreissena polymorpha TaxID=45954 RepID=UPI00226463ED|nr:S-formylglutathione hydrolase-like [Dreissena polymorpha]